ncbi:hypothetical protein GALL_496930 [mine drainage metagenome]|uniref:EF-hand domain-containing protein n=1 Tax=mine drainage metagenome TaxID=410659 RepID=A0A1J5PBK9_9ZZZZ
MALRKPPHGMVTQTIVDAPPEFQAACVRANQLSQMHGCDLDGDGVISAEEIALLEICSEPPQKAALLLMLDT